MLALSRVIGQFAIQAVKDAKLQELDIAHDDADAGKQPQHPGTDQACLEVAAGQTQDRADAVAADDAARQEEHGPRLWRGRARRLDQHSCPAA